MNTELKPCPICGAKAAFKYGGKISNGMRLVKVGCSIGCVEQGIYHMTEEKAAMPWNGRIEQASQPQFKCAARSGNTGANDPQDCDWPVCGCDAYADKVIAALQESGRLE